MVLTTINRTPKAYLIAILGAEHLTGVVPVGAWWPMPGEGGNATHVGLTGGLAHTEYTHPPTHPPTHPFTGTHDWRKFLQPQELARFGRAAGLRVRDVSGLVYNPWTGVWRLKQEDTDVNYAMHLSK